VSVTASAMPTALGKYEVLRRLGAGGMAEVFLCRLSGIGGFDKRVVVKRVIPHHAHEPLFVEMFLDEARVAANLTHPNIVQIYEIGEVDGVPFIAMEYVRGPTLSQVLRAAVERDAVSIGAAARLLAGVCEGLDHAHEARDHDDQPLGIVHRDVSPQNILIGHDGTSKVFDFGIARAAGRLVETQVASLKGKLAYMAPEQLRAQPIDRRADVYAAGVCLFEATTGRRLFAAATDLDLYALRMTQRAPAPSAVVPGYPPELERIVVAALAEDPAERTPSCRALADQLDEFVAAGPHAATTKTVAAWIASLQIEVVGAGPESRPGATPARRATLRLPSVSSSGGAGSTGPAPASAPTTAPPTTAPPTAPRHGRAGAVLLGAAVTIVLGGLAWWRFGASAATPPAAPVGATTSPSPDAAVAAVATADVVAATAAPPPLAPIPPALDAGLASASTISIRGDTAGRVYVDDALIGSLPVDQRAIAPGPHLIEVRRPGQPTVRKRIRLAEGAAWSLDLGAADPAAAVGAAPSTRPPDPRAAAAVAAAAPPVVAPPVTAPPVTAPPVTAPPVVAPPPVAPPPVAPPRAPVVTPPPATAPLPPRLPPTYAARSLKEVESVLAAIENEAVARGRVSPAAVRGTTRKLAERIVAEYTPGTPIALRPRAIYQYIVDGAIAGQRAAAIASGLSSAYAKGAL